MLPSPMLAGLLGSSQLDPSVLNNPALLRLLSPTLTPSQQPVGLDTAGTMAPPQVPMQAAPSSPAPPSSGWQNLLAGLFPDQTGMGGLLAPDAMTQARSNALLSFGTTLLDAAGPHFRYQAPSLGQAVAHGLEAGRNAMQQSVDRNVQNQLSLPLIKMQLQSLAARQQLQGQFPQLAGLSPDQLAQRLPALAAQYAAAGDLQTAGQLASLAKTLGLGANRLQAVQAGDAIYTFDPATGKYTLGPQRGIPQEKLDEDAQNRKLRGLQIQEGQYALAQHQAQAISSAFDKAVAPLATHLTNISQAEGLLKLAQTDPSAWGPATTNFIQATDAKPQLRYQLLEFLGKQIGGPSLVQKARLMLDEHLAGTFDPKIAAAMQSVLENERNVSFANYERRRQGVLARHKDIAGLEDWLAPATDIYAAPAGSTGAPTAGGSSPLWQFAQP